MSHALTAEYRICEHCDRPMRTQWQPIEDHPDTVRCATKTACKGCTRRIEREEVKARATPEPMSAERLAEIAAQVIAQRTPKPKRMPFVPPMPDPVVVEPGVTAENWRLLAACRDVDPALFFPEWGSGDQKYTGAKRVCDGCPSSAQCLDSSMEIERGLRGADRGGMYGGLRPGQRARLDLTAPNAYEARKAREAA